MEARTIEQFTPGTEFTLTKAFSNLPAGTKGIVLRNNLPLFDTGKQYPLWVQFGDNPKARTCIALEDI